MEKKNVLDKSLKMATYVFPLSFHSSLCSAVNLFRGRCLIDLHVNVSSVILFIDADFVKFFVLSFFDSCCVKKETSCD